MKPSGRQLGKLSHSNPGVLFEYVSWLLDSPFSFTIFLYEIHCAIRMWNSDANLEKYILEKVTV